jgi:hypothetical protein
MPSLHLVLCELCFVTGINKTGLCMPAGGILGTKLGLIAALVLVLASDDSTLFGMSGLVQCLGLLLLALVFQVADSWFQGCLDIAGFVLVLLDAPGVHFGRFLIKVLECHDRNNAPSSAGGGCQSMLSLFAGVVSLVICNTWR